MTVQKQTLGLNKSDQLADAILGRSPRDSDALFAKVLNLGLRGDYVALIQIAAGLH